MDLRFQVLDGKLWLFNREANQKNQAEVSVGDILIDNKAPQQLLQSKVPDSMGKLPWFPWDELTAREPEQTPVCSQQSQILLQNSDRQTGTALLLGHRSVVTSVPAVGTCVKFAGFHSHDFPPQDLLSSRFAEIRQIGLKGAYLKHARDIDRQFRREGHSQRLHRELKNYGNGLQQILTGEQGESPATITLACLLAGFSENAAFQTPLRALLQHPSESVRDSAAIGLGLLGHSDAIDRLRYLTAQPEPNKETMTDQLHLYTRQHATWALKRCGE